MHDDIVRQPPPEEPQQPPAENTPSSPEETINQENAPEVASDGPQTKSNKPVAVIAVAILICIVLVALTIYEAL